MGFVDDMKGRPAIVGLLSILSYITFSDVYTEWLSSFTPTERLIILGLFTVTLMLAIQGYSGDKQ